MEPDDSTREIAVRAVLRRADAASVVRYVQALGGEDLEFVLERLAAEPHLPDGSFLRYITDAITKCLPKDSPVNDPLYALVARGSRLSLECGVRSYFIDPRHPCHKSKSVPARVLSSRVFSDVSTTVWPAAFNLASAMAALLSQEPGAAAAFGSARDKILGPARELRVERGPVLLELGAATGMASLLIALALSRAREGGQPGGVVSDCSTSSSGSTPRHATHATPPVGVELVVTDGDPAAVACCAENIALNADWLERCDGPVPQCVRVKSALLDWSERGCGWACRSDRAVVPSDPLGAVTPCCMAPPLRSSRAASSDAPRLVESATFLRVAANRSDADVVDDAWQRASVIYGSDLVYGIETIEPLVALLCAFLRQPEASEAAKPPALQTGALRGLEEPHYVAEPTALPLDSIPSRFALICTTRRNTETYDLFLSRLFDHRLLYADITDALQARLRAAGGGWSHPLVDLRVPATLSGNVDIATHAPHNVRTALIYRDESSAPAP
jgi:hypothetical protein